MNTSIPDFEFLPIDFFDNNSISFQHNSNPLVSIIIPVYNQLSYTLNCLYSIKRACSGIDYEIILINDNSTDDTKEYLDRINGIHVIHNEVNLGFLKNINNGVKASKGEYVLLLNNDVIVLPRLLEELLAVFKDQERVGAVGGMAIHPSGVILEAGSVLLANGGAVNIGREFFPDDPRYHFLKRMDYCSGCCLLLKRNLPDNTLVQLDELFLPAYYEETDLCMQLKHKFNLDVYYQPFAKIIHFESISYNAEDQERKQGLIDNNRIKFYNKWKAVFSQEPYGLKLNTNYLNKDYIGKCEVYLEDYLTDDVLNEIGGKDTIRHKVIVVLKTRDSLKEEKVIELQKQGVEVLFPFITKNKRKKSFSSMLKYAFGISDVVYTKNPFYYSLFFIIKLKIKAFG
ncbi:glycosyltransferase family 2 protein [Hanstruepera flava]|uniref:glycosyltransferase family 2 protein n=1 Tax=Hanstruepera flava TaxID=2930218 RepID=UPI002028F652|nr:glycosyltransferase family 2 protein [Hanstruepera flava]